VTLLGGRPADAGSTPLGERVAAVPHPRPRASTITAYGVIIGIVLLGVWSIVGLEYNLKNLERTFDNLQRFFGAATPLVWPGFTSDKLPDGTVIISFEGWDSVATFVGHIVITLSIVLASTALAALLSIPVAYGAARNTTPHQTVMAICRGIGVVARAVPDVVLVVFFAYLWFGAGTLAAIIAVGLHSIGMISKMMADAIEQTDEGPTTAVKAVGATKAQQFWSGIVPQALPAWIAVALHRADINLRATVILGVVGVVGLGYDLFQALHAGPAGMRRSIPLVIIIVILCILFEIVSSTLRARLLGVRPTGKGIGDTLVRKAADRSTKVAALLAKPDRASDAGARIEAALHRPWNRERVQSTTWIWLAVAILAFSFFYSALDPASNWSKIFTLRWDLIVNPALDIALWPPTFGSRDWADVLGAVLTTVQVAFAGTLMSAVIAAVVGPLAARNVAPNGAVRNFFRVFTLFFRAIPDLVVAIFFIIATGLGPQAGALALGIGGVGLLGKLLADSMEEVPNGPERAIQTVGGTRLQVFFASTVPLSVPSLVSHLMYMLEQNIRSATLLGIVGGGGIGFLLLNALEARHFDQVIAFLVVIIALVFVVEAVSVAIRRAVR
jgi:phosphonate transport system permease protein